jgi:phosphoribosylformylglycinamidine synthase I
MPHFAVIRFPGSNCDDDARHAMEHTAGQEARLMWHTDADLTGVAGVVVPGGFSYGDYLRSGALAAQSPSMLAVAEFARRGGPVLGICNGFQVLTESGLLPGALARNQGLSFVCRTVRVQLANPVPLLPGLRAGTELRLPVAHHDGRFVADPATLDALERDALVAWRYHPDDDPNGSMNAIAGVRNAAGNVLGMMPHPERACEAILGGQDGAPVIRAFSEYALAWFQGANA